NSKTRFRSIVLLVEQELSEPVEAFFPLGAMRGDPFLEGIEAGRFNAASADTADFFRTDEAACLQDREVLGHGGQGDGEWTGELRNRGGRCAQPVQNGSARGVAQSMKDAVDIDLARIDFGEACFLFVHGLLQPPAWDYSSARTFASLSKSVR